MDGRHQEAQLLRQVLAQRLHPCQQLASLLCIDQRHQADAHLQHQVVQLEYRIHRIQGRRARFCRGSLGSSGRLIGDTGLLLPGHQHDDSAQGEEGELRHSGNQGQSQQNSTHNPQRTRGLEHLLANVHAQRLVGGSARHHDAPRHGYQQRRDNRHQSVTHGQDGIGLHGLRKVHALLEYSDEQPSNDVDDHDEDCGQRIPLAEAGCAVHGAAELRFGCHRIAARAGLVGGDEPGIQVGVDGHLLARHGVEREAGRDLGGTNGAVADHQILNRDQRQKYDKADYIVAANHKLAECLNYLSRG